MPHLTTIKKDLNRYRSLDLDQYINLVPELRRECARTAVLYAIYCLCKEEIAEVKYKAISTINTQLQTAFLIMDVRNGRELSILLAERVTNTKIRIEKAVESTKESLKDVNGKSIISIILLCIYLSGHWNCDIRRYRRIDVRRKNDMELIIE